MRALAVVGFSNLTEEQHAVASVVQHLSSRLSSGLAHVNIPGLQRGLFVCCYFERYPTGKVPIHLRANGGLLVIRMDIVAPSPDASVQELVLHMTQLWAAMSDRLTQYLKRRDVAARVVELVRAAVSLPTSSTTAATEK
jgi:hypothetical protein